MRHQQSIPVMLRKSPAAEVTRHLLSEEQATALLEAVVSPPKTPAKFSLKRRMTGVRSQGQQGSCASFAAAACLERIHRTDLSEAQIQHESEDNCKEGLPVIRAFRTCKRKGAVKEIVWKYDEKQVCWSKPPSTKGKTRYKFRGIKALYHRERRGHEYDRGIISKIKTPMFARRQPVCVSVPVWDELWYTGKIGMPAINRKVPGGDKGWHAIAICAWDNKTSRFTFKNSWGPDWGNKGYGTIRYEYVSMYSDVALIGWS